MTRMKSFTRFAAVLLLAALVAVPSFAAARGKADFTRIVALGDSLMAGYESGSLNNAHQPFSPPAQFARQVGATDFQQPLISFPGVAPEIILTDISKFPPTLVPAPGLGQPLNLNLPRPYNNLAVPGATIGSLLKVTGAENPPIGYFPVVLRGQGTAVQQALALHPTFILADPGNNDYLGAATAGTPALLTSSADFKAQYAAFLDALIAGAPDAGIVVSNLPENFLKLPFFTAIPPVLINPATNQPVVGPDGKPIFYITQSGGQTVQLDANSFVLLPYSGLLQQGYGIPPALKAVPPFNALPHTGEPLPDIATLTGAEAATIVAAVKDFNNTITTLAAARNIPVANLSAVFDQAVAGLNIGPFHFSSAFISGGLISLDGIHPTDIGYALMTNAFIKATNDAYGTNIPVVSIAQFFANNDNIIHMASGLPATGMWGFAVSEQAKEQMLASFRAPALRHRHFAASH
jgi:lysophospholipase L1-like esterase